MAVPAPSIAPSAIPGGKNHLVFTGNVGVAGVSQNLNISLMAFPEQIRKDPSFQDQLQVTFKALDDNITFVGPATLAAGNFFDNPNVNEYVQVQVTSDLTTRQCMVIVEHRHSIGR